MSYREIFLRLEPYIITFSSICLTIPFSQNTFSHYIIWDTKVDSRDIAWFLSYPFPFGPSRIIGFASGLSDTSNLFYFPACSSRDSGAIVAGALVMVVIATCIGLMDFSVFMQDTDIS